MSDTLTDSEWDRMAAQARRLRDEFQNYNGAAKIFRFLMEARPHEVFPRIQLGICCNKWGMWRRPACIFKAPFLSSEADCRRPSKNLLSEHGVALG